MASVINRIALKNAFKEVANMDSLSPHEEKQRQQYQRCLLILEVECIHKISPNNENGQHHIYDRSHEPALVLGSQVNGT